jgi:hypothetical protein
MAGVGQLSPGAYLLRRNLYPSIYDVRIPPKPLIKAFHLTQQIPVYCYAVSKFICCHLRCDPTSRLARQLPPRADKSVR